MRDRHDLVDQAGRRRRLPGDTDSPAARGGPPGHGDVAAEAHEHSAPDLVGDVGGGPVGRQGLRRRAQVESDATRNPHGASAGVELHVPVARHGAERLRRCGRSCLDLVEVSVVAERRDGIADGRVDRPAGPLGRGEGHVERLEEKLSHLDGTSHVGVQHLELRVLAKAAAGQIEGFEVGCQGALGHITPRRGPARRRSPWCRWPEEGAGGEQRPADVGRAGHRDDPPDVTVGDDWLTEGAVDDVPVFPVSPVLPVSPEFPDEEWPEVADDPPVVAAPEPDDAVEVPVTLAVLLEPGWSRDTTTPMTTVAPVAAKTAPRVSERSRDLALSLLSGVRGWSIWDMWSGYLCSGDAPIPPSPNRHRRSIRCGSAVTLCPGDAPYSRAGPAAPGSATPDGRP